MPEPPIISNSQRRKFRKVSTKTYSKKDIFQQLQKVIGGKNWKKKIVEENKKYYIKIETNNKGKRHISDDIEHKKVINYNDIQKINGWIKNSIFIKSSPLKHKRNDSMDKFYYFKSRNKNLYFHVGRIPNADGEVKYVLYSITDKLK